MDQVEALKKQIAEFEAHRTNAAVSEPTEVAVTAVIEATPKKSPGRPPKAKVEDPVMETVQVEEVKEDRSAYNCPQCKGEGLWEASPGLHRICDKCHGTGKI